MMLFLRFAWRELRQRPSRPILTLLSVVIGVGAVVAVTIASGTASRAFDQIFKTVAGRASLEVRTNVGTSFDAKVAEQIRAVEGVVAVAPMLGPSTKLQVKTEGRGTRTFTTTALGVDAAVDRQVRDYDIVEGKPLPASLDEESGVLLDVHFARNQGIGVGDVVTFGSRQGGLIEANVLGLYSSNAVSTSGAGAPMYLPLVIVQDLWHQGGRIESAQIVTDPKADLARIEHDIAALLPAGVVVQAPATQSEMAKELSVSTEQGMRMARGFSILVAVFIIANTFLINVAQRRKQIGIMRAIGSTRAQTAGMLYREALLMGALGTILGSLLGIVAAHYLAIAMGTLYQSELPSIELTPWPFVIAAVCGLGISLVSAILPARKASQLSPLEAMRDVLPEEIEGVQWWFTASGAAIVCVCLLVMGITIIGKFSMIHVVWTAVLMLAGLVLLLPVALGPISRLTTYLLKPFAPVESRLARQQLLRHRSRTTLTVAVVFMAAATGLGLASTIMDHVNNVRSWYQKTIVADFFVRASEPSMATGLSPDLPDGVGDAVKKVEGITSVEATRLGRLKLDDVTVSLIARDYTADEKDPDLDVVKGDLAMLREQFKNGAVAIGSVLAQRKKLSVGDTISFTTETGEKKFPVAAVVNDYQSGGLTIHMERAVARNDLGYEGVSGYIIKADKTKLAAVQKELQAIADSNGILLQTTAEVRARVDRMMSGVVASLWAMVVLGLMVSAVGVTNTLTINVLEQTRELGLLRIVAMTQAQVRRTIFSQAVIIGILALIPGIVAGVTVAYLINLATMSVTGHAVVFKLHPFLLAGGLVAGMAVVAFAAWFPANRAAKLDLLDALRTL